MADKTLTLDGKVCTFKDGETVLEAAWHAGIAIPNLCFDPRLKPMGSCRLCVVKVEGMGKLPTSCNLPAREGMKVTTEDAELYSLRKALLQLVSFEGPETCEKCDAYGPCELHQLTQRYGIKTHTGKTSGKKRDDDTNAFLARDYSKCIMCYRCVRICDEIEGDNAIQAGGRGFTANILSGFDEGLLQSSCTMCGQCIHTCPTGALMDKKILSHIAPHPKEKLLCEETTVTRTTCPYCGTGCQINLHAKDNQVVGVTPVMEGPTNEGALCVKGQFGWDFIASKDRLTKPLIREDGCSKNEPGRFREASWDEALGLIAERFNAIKKEHGPDALNGFSSARTTNEANYLFQKLFRAGIGTNNIDNCSRT